MIKHLPPTTSDRRAYMVWLGEQVRDTIDKHGSCKVTFDVLQKIDWMPMEARDGIVIAFRRAMEFGLWQDFYGFQRIGPIKMAEGFVFFGPA